MVATVEPSKGACRDCSRFVPSYMVRDAVWFAAWPTYREDKIAANRQYKGTAEAWKAWLLLCLQCLEKRLGRRLILKDFESLPVNDIVFFAYEMALRGPNRGTSV